MEQLFSSLEPYGHTPFRGRIRELLENYVEDMQTAGSTGPPPKPLIVVILMNEPPSKLIRLLSTQSPTSGAFLTNDVLFTFAGDEAGDDNLAGVIRHHAKLMDERNHPPTQVSRAAMCPPSYSH